MTKLPKKIKIVITPQMVARRSFGDGRRCPLFRVAQLALRRKVFSVGTRTITLYDLNEYKLVFDFDVWDYDRVARTKKPFKTTAVLQPNYGN